jgi:hypothetical protein
VSEQRAHLIDRLYADPRAADVLLPTVDFLAGMVQPKVSAGLLR